MRLEIAPGQTRRQVGIVMALVSLLAAGVAMAQPSGSSQQATVYVPDGWQGAYDFGYAPVIRVGDKVIVSGVPASGDGSYEEKIRRMYERARDLLQAAGASLADVVELTSFHVEPTDSRSFGAEFARYMPIHREFFGEHRPAWTAVGTTALLDPSAPVEVRFVAYVGSGENRQVVTGSGDR